VAEAASRVAAGVAELAAAAKNPQLAAALVVQRYLP